jgi:hypothetical protein
MFALVVVAVCLGFAYVGELLRKDVVLSGMFCGCVERSG